MSIVSRRARLGHIVMASVALDVFLAVGVIGGGLALMLGPQGQIIPLPLSLLQGTPFSSFLWPGLILFAVLGLGPLAIALLAWQRHRLAPLLTVGVGVALLVWITVEVAMIGHSNEPPLQPIYFVLGFVIVFVGLAWVRQTDSLRAT